MGATCLPCESHEVRGVCLCLEWEEPTLILSRLGYGLLHLGDGMIVYYGTIEGPLQKARPGKKENQVKHLDAQGRW